MRSNSPRTGRNHCKAILCSEIDKHAIKVTQSQYPDTVQLGDILDLDVSILPEIDLLIGGSPCQSFSVAGDGTGFDGKSKIVLGIC